MGLVAAIPYFSIATWEPNLPGLGPMPFDPWAVLVCIGFVLGLELARHRGIRLGLDVRDIVDGALFIVGMGFLWGHILTVTAYYPERMYPGRIVPSEAVSAAVHTVIPDYPDGVREGLGSIVACSATVNVAADGMPERIQFGNCPVLYQETTRDALREWHWPSSGGPTDRTVTVEYGRFSPSAAFWAIARVWEGFSSFGGFIGAVIGATVFYKKIRPRPFFRHADAIVFGFPFGWFFGRLGCGTVHDHIGRETTFPLAMDFDHGFIADTWKVWTWHIWRGDPAPFADGVRHELGLYEAAYMVPVCILWLALGRRDRVPGFFLGMFAVVYAPIRFLLDFLRNADLGHQDARYLGLTPAQYGSLVMLLAGVAILATRDWKNFVPTPLDRPADPEPPPAGP